MEKIIIDVIIPTVIKDKSTLELSINGCLQYVSNLHNIYIICKNEFIETCKFDNISEKNIIFFPEEKYPFNMTDVQQILGKNDRNGWYFQQLLKLYSFYIIPDISENILIVDSDTIFLKPISFFSNNIPLYNVGTEYHIPYFNHMQKLHPNFTKKFPLYSGICHHMLMQKKYVNEIFNMVETYHNDVFWKIFLNCVDKNDILGAGASEYEIYFNYIFKYYNNNVKIRVLKWKNSSRVITSDVFDYISCHAHMRKK
jgi:hypothetical protein